MGSRLSHTTFMRRLAEEIGAEKIVQVGVRAICKADLKFANESGLRYITANEISKRGSREITKTIHNLLKPYKRVYLTVDVDVLDPAFAPAVANPEPDGISTAILLDILQEVCDKRFVGFDLTEVTPHYDEGVTAIQAAKILFEILCFIKKT
jgi:agmatinase